MPSAANRAAEWLQADGLGGFASGTVCGERTRRYHALLLVATTPPTGRFVLVNGLEAWVDTPSGSFAISTQRYQGGFVFPDNNERLVDFSDDPWPRWMFHLEDGTTVEQELFVPHGAAAACLQWRLVEPRQGVALRVRPLLSGRDYHQLHHENPAFRFDPSAGRNCLTWSPYEGLPGVRSWANAHYQHDPQWYRRFYYEQEHQRGLDDSEDLASPGILRWDLSQQDAVWVLAAYGVPGQLHVDDEQSPESLHAGLLDAQQQRRARFPSRLEFSADAYLVAGRGQGTGGRGQGAGDRGQGAGDRKAEG